MAMDDPGSIEHKKRKAAMDEERPHLLPPPPTPAAHFQEQWYWEGKAPPLETSLPPSMPPPQTPPSQALNLPPPPPPTPEEWLQAVPAPRPDALDDSGHGDSESAPSFLGQCIYARFMALQHVLEVGFARKALAILRAFGLCARDVTSDMHDLQPHLASMCQAVGCTFETLLQDANVIQHLRGVGVPATKKQKRTFEPCVCNPFIQELYNAGAPALLLILSAGQKRICGNDHFTKRYLIKDSQGHNLSAPELLERIIVPEDLDELVECLLGMLFASGCGSSTGETSTILKCHDNQNPTESHLALARARFQVGDAGEYLCLVLSLPRLPTHNKYLVVPPATSEAARLQMLGSSFSPSPGLPIMPMGPYDEDEDQDATTTSTPSLFAAGATRAVDAGEPGGFVPV